MVEQAGLRTSWRVQADWVQAENCNVFGEGFFSKQTKDKQSKTQHMKSGCLPEPMFNYLENSVTQNDTFPKGSDLPRCYDLCFSGPWTA